MRGPLFLTIAVALAIPATGAAQIALPGGLPGGVGDILPDLRQTLPIDRLEDLRPARAARELVRQRVERLRAVVAANPRRLELDRDGAPAVRGELLVLGADRAVLAAANAAGFATIGEERIEGLGLGYARLRVPAGMSLSRAIGRLERIAPGAEISANHLHFPSGGAIMAAGSAALAQSGAGGRPIGLIDGGVARHAALGGAIEQRGFVDGAPRASGHGTAVASLLVGSGSVRGPAAGAPLRVADVYGDDPTGGNAVAIARALGWMAAEGVPVVTISLVGPRNALLAGAVDAVQKRGVTVVAAAGNDGPAAPPAYPASYPGVIAVTGVDSRNRALIEAGRGDHLDFAAPGADMLAADADGGTTEVRGTSYAAPLVAARLFALGSRAALDEEARDLGQRGTDPVFGRGLVCGGCRTEPK